MLRDMHRNKVMRRNRHTGRGRDLQRDTNTEKERQYRDTQVGDTQTNTQRGTDPQRATEAQKESHTDTYPHTVYTQRDTERQTDTHIYAHRDSQTGTYTETRERVRGK